MMARTTTFGHSNRGVQMETNYGTINQFKNHAGNVDKHQACGLMDLLK